MKTKYILILCLALSRIYCFGHDQIVHETITVNAAESALDNSPNYSNFLNIVSTDLPSSGPKSGTNLLRIGSYDEDFKLNQDPIGGNRSLNHFYDPIRKTGLNDWGWPASLFTQAPLGQNSYDWGSISNEPTVPYGPPINKIGTSNIWSWPNARSYEWLGLTATNKV
jgi:hypothetical protein